MLANRFTIVSGGSVRIFEFLDSQEAFILKQGDDGVPIAELCHRVGISQATFFN